MAPTLSPVEARLSRPVSAQVGKIYQLQAAFHRAKTTQDIDLMMSLWDANGILHNQGDPNSPYIGFDRLKSFWQRSGSFTAGSRWCRPSRPRSMSTATTPGSTSSATTSGTSIWLPGLSRRTRSWLAPSAGWVKKEGKKRRKVGARRMGKRGGGSSGRWRRAKLSRSRWTITTSLKLNPASAR